MCKEPHLVVSQTVQIYLQRMLPGTFTDSLSLHVKQGAYAITTYPECYVYMFSLQRKET